LERNPARFLPEAEEKDLSPEVVEIDLNQPMDQIRQILSRYPIKTRLSLTGPIIVARDIAHAKIKEMVENGADVPWYFRDHVIYYAGPAKNRKDCHPAPLVRRLPQEWIATLSFSRAVAQVW